MANKKAVKIRGKKKPEKNPKKYTLVNAYDLQIGDKFTRIGRAVLFEVTGYAGMMVVFKSTNTGAVTQVRARKLGDVQVWNRKK